MPTITLQDGQVVHISQESYDALAQAVKPKELAYDEVSRKLFVGKRVYYMSSTGKVSSVTIPIDASVCNPNDAPTENQVKQLLVLNKLFNVAYYLNEGWVPDWNNVFQRKCCIMIDNKDIIIIGRQTLQYMGTPYFKTEELAQKAILILGEKAIKECFGIFE